LVHNNNITLLICKEFKTILPIAFFKEVFKAPVVSSVADWKQERAILRILWVSS